MDDVYFELIIEIDIDLYRFWHRSKLKIIKYYLTRGIGLLLLLSYQQCLVNQKLKKA